MQSFQKGKGKLFPPVVNLLIFRFSETYSMAGASILRCFHLLINNLGDAFKKFVGTRGSYFIILFSESGLKLISRMGG